MKKSGIIPLLRGILVWLSVLNLGVLLMSILTVKPLWIGLSISFFALMIAFQNHNRSEKSEELPVFGKEKTNAD
ncbi:hypothetical protein QG516_10130 [Pedobacter gandavensis]|uniref:hypothetical protein n=1 Tax=Pedobacter TaxID=84567 RepID=UPI001C98FD4C|nr:MULTISPECIES: hypothetical protein [Pedobacter]WGQ11996.1 hypothetical protein QG516_10130 [Pedobacter gandavensis]